jgi:hypothetical protein
MKIKLPTKLTAPFWLKPFCFWFKNRTIPIPSKYRYMILSNEFNKKMKRYFNSEKSVLSFANYLKRKSVKFEIICLKTFIVHKFNKDESKKSLTPQLWRDVLDYLVSTPKKTTKNKK